MSPTVQDAPSPLPSAFPPRPIASDPVQPVPCTGRADTEGLCDQWAQALVTEAVTCRPVDEVTDLLALLRADQHGAVATALGALAAGRPVEDLVELVGTLRSAQPSLADELVRAAVVSRPVEEVAHLLAQVAAPGSEEARVALRTAAVGRSVADVARLTGFLRMPVVLDGAALEDSRDQGPTMAEPGSVIASEGGSSRAGRRTSRRYPHRWIRAGLGWLAACALLVAGALHLPAARSGWAQWPVSNGVLVVLAGLCIGYAVLVVRHGDSRTVWAGYAAVAALMIAVDIASRQEQLTLGPKAAHWLVLISSAVLITEAAGLLLAAVRLLPVRPRTGPRGNAARTASPAPERMAPAADRMAPDALYER